MLVQCDTCFLAELINLYGVQRQCGSVPGSSPAWAFPHLCCSLLQECQPHISNHFPSTLKTKVEANSAANGEIELIFHYLKYRNTPLRHASHGTVPLTKLFFGIQAKYRRTKWCVKRTGQQKELLEGRRLLSSTLSWTLTHPSNIGGDISVDFHRTTSFSISQIFFTWAKT